MASVSPRERATSTYSWAVSLSRLAISTSDSGAEIGIASAKAAKIVPTRLSGLRTLKVWKWKEKTSISSRAITKFGTDRKNDGTERMKLRPAASGKRWLP